VKKKETGRVTRDSLRAHSHTEFRCPIRKTAPLLIWHPSLIGASCPGGCCLSMRGGRVVEGAP